jgi:Fe-S cluster assembly protein SufD
MSANGVPEVLRSKGMSEGTVKALSSLKGEPNWLTEKRLEAWRGFESLPMPTLRDEAWRYTDISDVRIEDFLPYASSPDVKSEEDLPDAVRRLIREGEENSALLVQHNSETTFSRVDEELARKGVVFTDLHTALADHEELVKEKLFGLVPGDYDKFAALSAAAFAGGSFLYVPRGVGVEVPIQSYRWLDVVGSIMPRTLVIVEEGASVAYIDEYASADGEDPAFSNGAVELYVGEGASLRYVSLQNWERNVLHFNTIRSQTEKDATIRSLVVSTSPTRTRSSTTTPCRTTSPRTPTPTCCTRALCGTSPWRSSPASSGWSRGRRRRTLTRRTVTSF